MEGKTLIGSVGSVLLALVGFILILYLAYFATKKIGKRMSVRGVGGKNIDVTVCYSASKDSVSIGQHGSIMLIMTAGKLLLVGITQNGMSLLSELDPSEIDIDEDSPQNGTMDFSQALKKAIEQKFGKKAKNSKENSEDNVDGSDS